MLVAKGIAPINKKFIKPFDDRVRLDSVTVGVPQEGAKKSKVY